ncbi:MAG: EAL domain-containing protein [Actinomyces sp.]|nr:MAG: EAL domain-containing protein [Actinomyces sp.]
MDAGAGDDRSTDPDRSGPDPGEVALVERRLARELLAADAGTVDGVVAAAARRLTEVLGLDAVGEFDEGPRTCVHTDAVGEAWLTELQAHVAAAGPVDGPCCLRHEGRTVIVVPTAPGRGAGRLVVVPPPGVAVGPDLVAAVEPVATLVGHARARLAAEGRLDHRLRIEHVRSRAAVALSQVRVGAVRPVLDEALGILVEGLGVSAAALFAVAEGGVLVTRSAVRADGRDAGVPERVCVPGLDRAVGRLAGRPCFFLDGDTVDREALGLPFHDGPNPHLIIGPVTSAGRLVGLLALVDPERRRWTDEELAALDEICTLVSGVRERLMAELSVREAAETEELVARVTRSLMMASADEHDAVLAAAAETVRAHFEVTSAAVWAVDADAGIIRCLAESGRGGQSLVAACRPVGVDDPLARFVLGLDQGRQLSLAELWAEAGTDTDVPEGWVILAPAADPRDATVVTLVDIGGGARGERAVAAVETIAGALGQFRRRVAAERELRRRLAHEDLLRRAAARLVRTTVEGSDALVDELVQEVLTTIGADYASLWRGNPVEGGVELVRLAEVVPDGVDPGTAERVHVPRTEIDVWGHGDGTRLAVWDPAGAPERLIPVLAVLPPGPRRVFAFAHGADGEGRLFLVVARPGTRAPSAPDESLVWGLLRLLSQHYVRLLAERWFAAAFMSAPVAISLRDAESNLLTCNPAYEELVGRTRDELVGTPLAVVREGEAPPAERFERHVTGEIDRTEIAYRRPDGSVVWGRVRSTRIELPGRPDIVVLTHIEDVTETRRSRALLEYQASHDDLTGLANRRSFVAEVQAALERGERCAVLVLDIDRFKVVNDSLGHSAGDELLVRCADRVRLSLRPGDRVCRLGGDEFAILLAGPVDEAVAAAVADRLLELLRDPVEVGDTEVFPSASLGVAFAEPGDAVEDLLRHADVAMYQAKSRGRDRWEVFDRDLREAVVERVRTETDLRRAIDNGQLEVHYQPEFMLATGEIVGAEALVRWRHPERGLLAAGSFIELAEETGLVVDLGRWVLETATRQARAWRAAGRDLVVRVNLSARQLRPAVVDEVAAALEASGLEAGALCLELTETAIMDDVAESERLLGALRELGVRLAVDDFGTGFSSLAYLKRFPVDILKIDRTFVDGVGVDPDDTAIVRSVIGLARTLKLDVVAEGIEDATQVDELLRLGCGRGQGFHLARPAPADEVELLFDAAVG